MLQSHAFFESDIAWSPKHLRVRSHHYSTKRKNHFSISSASDECIKGKIQINPVLIFQNAWCSGVSTAVPFSLRNVAAGRATKVNLIFKVFWAISRRAWAPVDKSGLSQMEGCDCGLGMTMPTLWRESYSLLLLIIQCDLEMAFVNCSSASI